MNTKRCSLSQAENSIDISMLSQFIPLNTLGPSELEILAGQLTIEYAKKGRILAECGQSDSEALFIIKGRVKLTAEDGNSHTIDALTHQALRPISHLNPHLYTIKCIKPVEFIRIDNELVDSLLTKNPRLNETVEDLDIHRELLDNPVFNAIYYDLTEDKLVLPTFPEIALRIQQIIDDKINLKQLEKIIQCDQATAAMIVKAANCALFNVGQPVQTIEQATQRMGIRLVKQLVLTYALRELFQSNYPIINNRLKRMWKHSTEVAATSYVLAKKLGGWDAEHALLLGLLHDIGVLPVLRYLENFPDLLVTDDMVDATIHTLHGDIGALILKAWRFSPDFITTSAEADDWYRDPQDEPDYCDIILLAQLHTFIGKSQDKLKPLIGNRPLPPITELPAYKKLCLKDCGPKESIAMLNEAKQQIMETLQLLSL